MAKIRKDFCPICGKVKISRDPTGKENCGSGGWQEKCPVCGFLLLVPFDPVKPIRLGEMDEGFLEEIFDDEFALLDTMLGKEGQNGLPIL